MPGRHGPDDETNGREGRRVAPADIILGKHFVRQSEGAVQRSLTGHAVNPRSRRKVLRERVLDHIHESLRRFPRLNLQLVKQLHHESRETAISAGYANARRHLKQHVLRRPHVNFEPAGLVQRGIDKSQ